MLYCQQCGAGNGSDARFCNQCGSKIAGAGEPGGPIVAPEIEPEREVAAPRSEPTLPGHAESLRAAIVEERAEEKIEEPPPERVSSESVSSGRMSAPYPPQQNLDVSTISLSAIGVRSRGKAWGVMIAVVVALLGLGALGMWLAMNMQEEGEEVAENDLPVPPDAVDPTEESVPDDEIEIGDPVPEGADPETSLITGTPRPRRTTDRAPTERTPTERAPTKRPSTSAQPSEGGSVPAPWTNEPSGERPSGDEQPASNQGSGSTNAEETRPNTIPQGEPDWEAMESEDPEMDAYSAQVRNVIRTYYMRRAQNCFDMATRNNASVRGTVVIGFDIQADGNIRNATVERNTTEIDTIGRCLATQVGGWRLPRPPGGSAPLAMQMPFSR